MKQEIEIPEETKEYLEEQKKWVQSQITEITKRLMAEQGGLTKTVEELKKVFVNYTNSNLQLATSNTDLATAMKTLADSNHHLATVMQQKGN